MVKYRKSRNLRMNKPRETVYDEEMRVWKALLDPIKSGQERERDAATGDSPTTAPCQHDTSR